MLVVRPRPRLARLHLALDQSLKRAQSVKALKEAWETVQTKQAATLKMAQAEQRVARAAEEKKRENREIFMKGRVPYDQQ